MPPIELLSFSSKNESPPPNLESGNEVLDLLRYLLRSEKITYGCFKMTIGSSGRLTLGNLGKLCPDLKVLKANDRRMSKNPLIEMGFQWCDIFTKCEPSALRCQGLPVVRQSQISCVSLKIGGVYNVDFAGSMFKVLSFPEWLDESRRFPYNYSTYDCTDGTTVTGYKEALGMVGYAGSGEAPRLAIVGACMLPRGNLRSLTEGKIPGYYFKSGEHVTAFLAKKGNPDFASPLICPAGRKDLDSLGGVRIALQKMFEIEIQ